MPVLVGVHSKYLSQSTRRPEGVVFVDLDQNRIITALDENEQVGPLNILFMLFRNVDAQGKNCSHRCGDLL